jgi:hypothetical protein
MFEYIYLLINDVFDYYLININIRFVYDYYDNIYV